MPPLHRVVGEAAPGHRLAQLLAVVALILWRYTLKRNLMDVNRSDFLRPSAVRDKLLVALGVLSLALLFAATHFQQIALFLLAALHAN